MPACAFENLALFVFETKNVNTGPSLKEKSLQRVSQCPGRKFF